VAVGENVARIAGLHLLSQGELAGVAKVSRQALNGITQGRREPSIQTAQRLSRALGIGLDDLYASDPVDALTAALSAFYVAPVRSEFVRISAASTAAMDERAEEQS
jgi:transcriptional regulator with XRE-family HTH domain